MSRIERITGVKMDFRYVGKKTQTKEEYTRGKFVIFKLSRGIQ